MTRLVPCVVSFRRHDLALRTQLRTYAGEAVTELVSQAGRVLCGGNRGFAAKPCPRPLAYFGRITGEKALCSQGFA
jgi:hypothetical protein